jgi:TRAP-type C4-dicarboxylate transport system permease small subunit
MSDIVHGGEGAAYLAGARPTPPPTLVERVPQWLCAATLVAMTVMITAEVLSRELSEVPLELADEYGGYMLVAITFLSLPICQAEQAFHRVEFLQARLSERGRAASELVFDLLCFAASAILLWQLARLEIRTWESGDTAPTSLATPLWMPRLTMPIGVGLLCLTMLRCLVRDLRRLARRG